MHLHTKPYFLTEKEMQIHDNQTGKTARSTLPADVCMWWRQFLFISENYVKGTVARDFWPLFFFMNQPHMGP
jgi:hypothetical protein